MFQDADFAPEMVVIPPGRFWMGSREDEAGCFEDEGPRHEVAIGYRFAVGRYPATFAEYEAFCAATGSEVPDDEGWGRGRRPVIHVSWDDAQNYVRWLSTGTGAKYRLLSEAEWEYCCRAGSASAYWWGDEPDGRRANFGREVGKTTEVGSYGDLGENVFRLRDMSGNVWEWTQDCWNESYAGAPADGKAWESGDCSRRVLRGGSWNFNPRNVRSALRGGYDTGNRLILLGFRVARALP